jgi:hypothetical protein
MTAATEVSVANGHAFMSWRRFIIAVSTARTLSIVSTGSASPSQTSASRTQ